MTNERVLRGIDYTLLRQLQAELGQLRQRATEQRRAARQPALTGGDARQHGRSLVQQVVTNYVTRRAEDGREELTWELRQDLIEVLEAHIFGAGSLDQLLQDPEVEEIDINGFDKVFVEYADGSTRRHPAVASSNEALIETIQNLAAHEGLTSRPFDTANPRVNLRLHDGSRLYAMQSVTKVPHVAIRKHRFATATLKDLQQQETFDAETAAFLGAAVRARKNIMVGGAVSAGKTTLLRALAREVDPVERLFTVERSLELGIDEDIEAHPNAVATEERLANAEGVGAYTMAELVRDSLRMNPSRVIVGEVLGDEVITMLNAMSQGNDGSLSTIHANSSSDVVQKIATYAIQAPERLPWQATVMLVASALDFVVFLRRIRTPDGGQRRVLASIREVVGGVDDHGQLVTNELWSPGRDGRGVRNTSVPIACDEDLVDVGWRPGELGWL